MVPLSHWRRLAKGVGLRMERVPTGLSHRRGERILSLQWMKTVGDMVRYEVDNRDIVLGREEGQGRQVSIAGKETGRKKEP